MKTIEISLSTKLFMERLGYSTEKNQSLVVEKQLKFALVAKPANNCC